MRKAVTLAAFFIYANNEQAGAAAGAQAGPTPEAGPAPDGFQGDDVVDGDYKEV